MASTLHFTIAGGNLCLDADGRRASAPLPDLPGDPFEEDLKLLALPAPEPREDAETRRLRDRLKEKKGQKALGRKVGRTLFRLLFPSEDFLGLYRQAQQAVAGLRLILELMPTSAPPARRHGRRLPGRTGTPDPQQASSGIAVRGAPKSQLRPTRRSASTA
ncbi:MAG: hypothetical protein Q7R39_13355 [Dehalococcoidia bacterium]|nr:hypothetical protein [Dehalococcoidia bacterium]